MQYAVFITLTSPDICHVLPAFLHHLILRHSPLPWLPQSTKVVSATDGQTHAPKEGCLKMRHNQKRNSGSQLRDYFRGWTDTVFSLNWQPRYIRIIYSTNFEKWNKFSRIKILFLKWLYCDIPYFPAHKMHRDFFVRNFRGGKKKYNKFSLWLYCWRCRIHL